MFIEHAADLVRRLRPSRCATKTGPPTFSGAYSVDSMCGLATFPDLPPRTFAGNRKRRLTSGLHT